MVERNTACESYFLTMAAVAVKQVSLSSESVFVISCLAISDTVITAPNLQNSMSVEKCPRFLSNNDTGKHRNMYAQNVIQLSPKYLNMFKESLALNENLENSLIFFFQLKSGKRGSRSKYKIHKVCVLINSKKK